jgi:hypothetical protein
MLCALVVVGVAFGLAVAEEFTASISKVDGGKVTFTKFQKKGEKGEAETLPVAKDAKITKGKFNFKEKTFEAGDAIEGGLKSETFTKIGEKGLFARITTSDDKKTITAISVMQFGGKKKKDKDGK